MSHHFFFNILLPQVLPLLLFCVIYVGIAIFPHVVVVRPPVALVCDPPGAGRAHQVVVRRVVEAGALGRGGGVVAVVAVVVVVVVEGGGLECF